MQLRVPCILLFLLVASRPAGADTAIVIESNVGDPPSEIKALLRAVMSELSKRGHLTGNLLVAKVNAMTSRDGGHLTASQSVEVQKGLDQAYELFIDGDYEGALTASSRVLATYESARGSLIKEPLFRDLQFKAFLIAARSQEVLGKGEESFRTMAEAIRTFPDRHVSTAEFDPRVNALFRRVRKELEAQGTGTLEVTVNDASVVVFLNERYVGTGSARVDGLFAGLYRVYVTKGDVGRLHGSQSTSAPRGRLP